MVTLHTYNDVTWESHGGRGPSVTTLQKETPSEHYNISNVEHENSVIYDNVWCLRS